MASLKKRGGNYSLVFKTHLDGKPITKTYALGTRYKKVAEQKKLEYERLYESGQINPFADDWNLKEFEKNQKLNGTAFTSPFLKSLREQFLAQKTNVTAKTRQTYRYILQEFADLVGETMPISRVNTGDIREFCLREDLALASQKNYLGHLRAFFNWVVEQDIIEANPCDDIRLPKVRDNLVEKIIDQQQLGELFQAFRKHQHIQRKARAIKHSGQMQFWFKPLITLTFYTGLRLKEVTQLQWSHVNLEERFLRVTDTKNGLERTVPIFDPVYWRLRAWRKFMGNPQTGYVFPSPKSTDKNQIQLSGRTVSTQFKSYCKKAGFKDSIHFHGLRHSCATFLLRSGFNVIEVKNMLGHKRIEVTNRYVHLVANDLLATANRNGLITT